MDLEKRLMILKRSVQVQHKYNYLMTNLSSIGTTVSLRLYNGYTKFNHYIYHSKKEYYRFPIQELIAALIESYTDSIITYEEIDDQFTTTYVITFDWS